MNKSLCILLILVFSILTRNLIQPDYTRENRLKDFLVKEMAYKSKVVYSKMRFPLYKIYRLIANKVY